MDYKDTNTATHTAWTELSASHTDTFSVDRSVPGCIYYSQIVLRLESSLFLFFNVLHFDSSGSVAQVLFEGHKWTRCQILVPVLSLHYVVIRPFVYDSPVSI